MTRDEVTGGDSIALEHDQTLPGPIEDGRLSRPSWHVIWTRSHCEQLVHDQLAAKGFELLLPTINRWAFREHRKRLAREPMFPGYLFIRDVMGRDRYIEVCKSRGLVRVLGSGWDRLATVPDDQVDAIRKIAAAHVPALPHPYLREGQRVRILRGPLANVCGILTRFTPATGVLVISVDLLHRSLAVEIDCTQVAPA